MARKTTTAPLPRNELRNRATPLRFGDNASARLVGRHALIDEAVDHPKGALVTMRTACATVQAIVPRSEVASLPETRTGSGYGTNCGGVVPGVDFQVPPRTRVYWRDGRAAGWTGRRISLHAYDREEVSKLACFPKAPNRFGCGNQGLPLCFQSEELTVIPVRQ